MESRLEELESLLFWHRLFHDNENSLTSVIYFWVVVKQGDYNPIIVQFRGVILPTAKINFFKYCLMEQSINRKVLKKCWLKVFDIIIQALICI